jgi:hypothetical protein
LIFQAQKQMEDNGLEPMTFWLPARERLVVSLLFLWAYGFFQKNVHCYVLGDLTKDAETRKQMQIHATTRRNAKIRRFSAQLRNR